jgi:hypothetical protein
VAINCGMPIKSASTDGKRRRLVYIEREPDFSRLVLQSDREEAILELLLEFMSTTADPCDVMLKVQTGEDPANGEAPWAYHLGSCPHAVLRSAIADHHDTVFHDGATQLLLRDPPSGAYICFDDHGLLFYYQNSYDSLLSNLTGYEMQDSYSLFLNDGPHWHYRSKDSEKKLSAFIVALQLNQG